MSESTEKLQQGGLDVEQPVLWLEGQIRFNRNNLVQSVHEQSSIFISV